MTGGYLADTSFLWRFIRRQITPAWDRAVQRGLVGYCPVVEAEIIRGCRGKTEHAKIRDVLNALFTWYPMRDTTVRLLATTQQTLLQLGHHQGPSIPDLLVAATAEQHGLTVVHLDADFDTLAKACGISTVRADRVGPRP